MIFRRGQLDHVITSIIVLFACFFIMALFYAFTIGLSIFAKPSYDVLSPSKSPQVSADALRDVFMHSSLNGLPITVALDDFADALRDRGSQNGQLPADEYAALLAPIERFFAQRYGCSNSNAFFVAKRFDPYLKVYIDYPKLSLNKLPLSLLMSDPNMAPDFDWNPSEKNFPFALEPEVSRPFGEGYSILKTGKDVFVGVKGGKIC